MSKRHHPHHNQQLSDTIDFEKLESMLQIKLKKEYPNLTFSIEPPTKASWISRPKPLRLVVESNDRKSDKISPFLNKHSTLCGNYTLQRKKNIPVKLTRQINNPQAFSDAIKSLEKVSINSEDIQEKLALLTEGKMAFKAERRVTGGKHTWEATGTMLHRRDADKLTQIFNSWQDAGYISEWIQVDGSSTVTFKGIERRYLFAEGILSGNYHYRIGSKQLPQLPQKKSPAPQQPASPIHLHQSAIQPDNGDVMDISDTPPLPSREENTTVTDTSHTPPPSPRKGSSIQARVKMIHPGESIRVSDPEAPVPPRPQPVFEKAQPGSQRTVSFQSKNPRQEATIGQTTVPVPPRPKLKNAKLGSQRTISFKPNNDEATTEQVSEPQQPVQAPQQLRLRSRSSENGKGNSTAKPLPPSPVRRTSSPTSPLKSIVHPSTAPHVSFQPKEKEKETQNSEHPPLPPRPSEEPSPSPLSLSAPPYPQGQHVSFRLKEKEKETHNSEFPPLPPRPSEEPSPSSLSFPATLLQQRLTHTQPEGGDWYKPDPRKIRPPLKREMSSHRHLVSNMLRSVQDAKEGNDIPEDNVQQTPGSNNGTPTRGSRRTAYYVANLPSAGKPLRSSDTPPPAFTPPPRTPSSSRRNPPSPITRSSTVHHRHEEEWLETVASTILGCLPMSMVHNEGEKEKGIEEEQKDLLEEIKGDLTQLKKKDTKPHTSRINGISDDYIKEVITKHMPKNFDEADSVFEVVKVLLREELKAKIDSLSLNPRGM